MKKFLILCLSMIMIACSLLMFGACGGGSETPDGPDNPSTPSTQVQATRFSFQSPIDSLIVGEEYTVPIDIEYIKGLELKYSSSNPEVASINEKGKITAIKPGKTTINGEYGQLKDSFELEVETKGFLPTVGFVSSIKDNNYIELGQSISIKPVVEFCGKQYTDFSVKYSLDNKDLGSINGDIFTAGTTSGVVNLTVELSWRDIVSATLTRTVQIEIVKEFSVLIDGGANYAIELYTKQLDNEIVAFENLSERISASYNKQSCNFDLEVINSYNELAQSNVVAYSAEDDKITALTEGKAILKVTVHTPDGDRRFDLDIITIRPVATVDTNIKMFETNVGEIANLETYIGSSNKIIEAYQNNRMLEVIDNKVLNVSRAVPNAMSVEEVLVYTSDCGYIFTLETYTKIIRKAEDLESLYNHADAAATYYQANAVKGYFYVANDIIYADDPVDINYHLSWTDNNVSHFSGTFEGNGHTIEYGLGNHHRGTTSGLFGVIYENALIQNAKFVVKKVPTDTTAPAFALASRIYGGMEAFATLKNIVVKYDMVDYTPSDVSKIGISYVTYAAKFENVVIDMSNVKGVNEALTNNSALKYGSIFGSNTSDTYNDGHYSFTNTFVISDVPYLAYSSTCKRFAENDSALKNAENAKEYVHTGLFRLSDYDATKAYFALPENAGKLQALGVFCDISMGFPFVGDKEVYVSNNAVLTVNESTEYEFELEEAIELTVALTFNGKAQEIVLAETSDDDNILSVNGNVISFNGNAGATATVEVTATIEGISYSKVITIKTSYIAPIYDEILINKDAGKIFLNGTSIENETIISVLYNDVSILSGGVIDVNALASVDLATPFTTTIETNAGIYNATNTLLYDKVWENTVDSRRDMAQFFSGIDISAGVYNGLGAKTLTGKYALAENITFANDFSRTTKLSSANGDYEEVFASDVDTATKSVTFSGEFDGRGYTMRNVATFYHDGSMKNNGGIFGILTSGATIKNLAIVEAAIAHWSTDMFVSTLDGRNASGNILFNKASGAGLTNITISDVYVEYTDMVNDNDFCVVKDMPSLVGSANNNQVSINNFVIVKKYVDENGNAFTAECSGNVFSTDPTSSTDKSENATIANSYVIAWIDRMTHYAYDIAGFVRYQDYAAFEGAGIDLNSFNNANWAIVNGAPVWAALQA